LNIFVKWFVISAILGTGSGFSSRTGAIQRAIEDFAKKALQSGVLKPEELASISGPVVG